MKPGGPLSRRTPLTSTTPLRRVGRAGREQQRLKTRRPPAERGVFVQSVRDLIYERCEGLCEVCAEPLREKGWAAQHRKARGMGGTHRIVTPADGIACHNRPCHLDLIEAYPALALDMGWRITQQDVAETAPLILPGDRRVLLDEDGAYVDMPFIGRYTLPRRPQDDPARCWCGCNSPATHRGMRDGTCLTYGCRAIIAAWVIDPAVAREVA